MAHVDFYYDIVCPYAYLGSTQIQAIADRCGASIDYKPILLGGVLQAVGSPTVPMNAMPPSKARHNLLDMERWADLWKVPFKFPNGHPRRSVHCMRTILASGDAGINVMHALYKAYWVDELDVAQPEVVAQALSDSGLNPEWSKQAVEQTIKDELRERTAEAVSRGVFGVPTCIVDGELFWGQDRMDFVEAALQAAA
jgi:2-hydroxychromene-2-carboxylate isomerase